MARNRYNESGNSIKNLFKGDSWAIRIALFLFMSFIFFVALKKDGAKVSRPGIEQDSTATSSSTTPSDSATAK